MNPARRAVILAAGIGQRLRPLTNDTPKCLVEVNGEPILCRALRSLADCGIQEAVIVVGYAAQKVEERIGPNFAGVAIRYVPTPDFASTGNICSLWSARSFCDRDIILLEGDIVFDHDVIACLQKTPGDSMAVAPYDPAMSGTVVRSDTKGHVTCFALGADQPPDFDFTDTFKTVNIYLLRAATLQGSILPEVASQIERGNVSAYYEAAFRDLRAGGSLPALAAVDVSALRWCEIDDQHDLDLASFLFLERTSQFDRLRQLHGSYWRYGVTDHVHAAHNPYFPPRPLLDGLRDDLERVIASYPVAQSELDHLVALWIGAPKESVVASNGAAQLIKILGEHVIRRLIVPVPTFNEYENVMQPDALVRFPLESHTFKLDAERFAEAARASRADAAVVVSPNIPTSMMVKRTELLELATSLDRQRCKLLVDESFLDFSSSGRQESVESAVADHQNLIVLKSMSKVLGIPGLRLGYLLTSDVTLANTVRRHLPIWNINGLAEAFLRRVGSYHAEFDDSCRVVYQTCLELYRGLDALPGISPFPPDANFVFCSTSVPDLTGADLARKLYVDHNILVKDCSQNTMPDGERFLRIGSCTVEQNRVLVEALGSVIGSLG
jgi:histidinol-phosphate/aromatic aminotransferase/cobyric acid decarboxylase-like protein